MFKYLTLIVFLVCDSCCAYKILAVFPLPGKSHSILGEGFVRHLLNAGHEVTYITPILVKNPPPRLSQIDVSTNFHVFPAEEVLEFRRLMNNEVDFSDMSQLYPVMFDVANATILHENVQKLLHDPKVEFDVVLAEWMFSELYAGLSSVFNCPLIWSSSVDVHSLVLELIDEEPNLAYAGDFSISIEPPFTFMQRVYNVWRHFNTKYLQWRFSGKDNKAYDLAFCSATEKRGHILPPLSETKYNASVMFGNSHVSCGQALRLPQNYIPILGYHIEEEVKPLPKDLQNIMDNAKNGVIYFSMGSMLKSKTLPKEIKQGLLDMFAGLDQTVIWKFEEALTGLPKNVHIVQWAPQQSILAHKNCILFITHGGLLSTTETIHFGVPIIGIPMFADQSPNVNRAVSKGFARRVDLNYDTPKNLKIAIQDVLANSRYREKAKELSFIYHDRPVRPGKELVHWVEHVVRTRGAPHLRSPALSVPCYQKSYLDLVAVILISVIFIVFAIRFTLTTKHDYNIKIKYS